MHPAFRLLLAGLATTQVAQAIPPPPEQSFVDCSQPVYAVDQLVCDDPELLALERRLIELVGQLDLDAVAATDPGFEAQPEWFRRRALCAFASAQTACLRALYFDRIVTLEALAAAGQGFDTATRHEAWFT